MTVSPSDLYQDAWTGHIENWLPPWQGYDYQPLSTIDVAFSAPVTRLDISWSHLRYEDNSCVTAGPIYVVTAAGAQVQVPMPAQDTSLGAEGCSVGITYRDTSGIVRVLAYPTPDAPKYYVDPDGYWCVTCYEQQWSSLSLRWDPPPEPQTPRCPPTGNGILDHDAFRDSLWVAMQRSNFEGPNHTRRERGGEVLVNKATGDTIIRFTTEIDSLSGPCTRRFNFTAESGYDLIAIFHTHPFAPGTRTAPHAGCGWTIGDTAVPPMARGFSEDDYRAQGTYDALWKSMGDSTEALSFFVNKEEVSWIGLRATKAQERQLLQKAKWKSKACRFFSAQPST